VDTLTGNYLIIFNKYIKDAYLLYTKKRTEHPKLIIRYGGSGTGKSESWYKLQQNNENDVFKLTFEGANQTVWWDEYHNQKYVVFEEYKPAIKTL